MLDFVQLARRYRIPHLSGQGHHHCKQNWVQVHCPFCAGGRSGWHLGFSLESGAWSCWRCGALRFWDVLPAVLKTSEQQARQIISEFQKQGKRVERTPIVRQRRIKPPGGAGELTAPHLTYLTKRGFNASAIAKEYELLGTNHLGGAWAWRIVIPIFNGEDRIVAYQGRTIGEAKPRYKMMDDALCLEPPDTMLYGINKVEGDAVIAVEGVPGVWRLGPGAVGTFGIDWKMPQANRLRRFKRRFVLFDPEPAAQRRAEELAAILSLFPGTTEILSGFETDPGDFSNELAASLLKELGI